MKVAPMGEVRNNFAKYLVACEREPVFVTRNGRITAVIQHLVDADVEDYLLERDPRTPHPAPAPRATPPGPPPKIF